MNDDDAKRLKEIREWNDSRILLPRVVLEMRWLLSQLDLSLAREAAAGPWLRLQAWVDAGPRRQADFRTGPVNKFYLVDGRRWLEADTIPEALAEAKKRWGDGD